MVKPNSFSLCAKTISRPVNGSVILSHTITPSSRHSTTHLPLVFGQEELLKLVQSATGWEQRLSRSISHLEEHRQVSFYTDSNSIIVSISFHSTPQVIQRQGIVKRPNSLLHEPLLALPGAEPDDSAETASPFTFDALGTPNNTIEEGVYSRPGRRGLIQAKAGSSSN